MTGGGFDSHEPASGIDTAGMPWRGRTLAATGFEGDTGRADPALVAALTDPDDERRLVAAVAAARLLVPVVAVPGEAERSSGPVGDAGSDMAAVTLVRPDGARALPVFSSVASLAGWDPSARPVPVSAQRAALAAVQEGCQDMVLDPPAPGTAPPGTAPPLGTAPPPGTAPLSTAVGAAAGARTAYTLRPSMVWALAAAREWIPAHEDPLVAAAVHQAVGPEPAVQQHGLAAGRAGALQLGLRLRPGLDADTVRELVLRVGNRLASDPEVRARIDAVTFALRG